MTRVDLTRVILNTNGRIFRATFVKRTTGETRNLIGRLGVRKGIKGVGMKYNPLSKGLLTVFDMKKDNFRHIDLGSLREVKFQGRTYRI